MGRHFKAIGACISKNQVIAFMYFWQLTIFSKCVCFANITNYIIISFLPRWIGNIFDLVISSVKHWTDQDD